MGISYYSLLPQTPLGHVSIVNSRLHPGITPQSLCSSSQLLCLLGDPCPCPEYIWLQQGLSVWFSFHLDCHTSAASLSASNVSLLSQRIAPMVGIRPLLNFPHPPRAGPVLLTLLFFPLLPMSYQFLCGPIYSFPVVRYCCLLSEGIPEALLCLKVCIWCIHGERCIPHPVTPLPSCSLPDLIFITMKLLGRLYYYHFISIPKQKGLFQSLFEHKTSLL